MLEKQKVPVTPHQGAGRVIFLPETKQDFLFFVPQKQSPLLKLLEGSMWFKIANATHGMIYRAATCQEALHWLRDTVGNVFLSPEVNKWRLSSQKIKAVDPIPHLPLFDFQREAVGFLRTRKRAMLSLSPGLGKTITSIATAELLRPEIHKILVVAPLSLLYMWKAEIEKWAEDPEEHEIIIFHGPKAHLNDVKITDTKKVVWVITNPESVVSKSLQLTAKNFHLMILDESILYKSRNSRRTKSVKKLAQTIPYVWELTGAPANRMLDDIWSQFNILNPKAFASYWRFTKEYCMTNPSSWGNQVIANKLGSEEKIKERFQDIYFARSQEEVLDIPDWLFNEIDIPMTKRQEKAYHELSILLATELEREHDDNVKVTVTNHLAKVTRLIQVASNPMLLDGDNDSGKWEALPELMKFYPGPYLVWVSFTRTAHYLKELLQKEIDPNVQLIIGATSSEDRQKHIRNFQAGKEQILILNMQTGSFGHTLTAARTAFYPERNYDSNFFQSLHRFRRIGTTQSPNVVFMKSIYQDGTPTIDHLVHSLLDYRVDMIRDLTTGMLRDIL